MEYNSARYWIWYRHKYFVVCGIGVAEAVQELWYKAKLGYSVVKVQDCNTKLYKV